MVLSVERMTHLTLRSSSVISRDQNCPSFTRLCNNYGATYKYLAFIMSYMEMAEPVRRHCGSSNYFSGCGLVIVFC